MLNDIAIFAQATDGIPTDIPYMDYINFGVLGVFLMGIFRGWVVTGREKNELTETKDQAIKEKKEAEEKFEEYQKKVHDEILPQLFETTRVLGEVTELLSSFSYIAEQLKRDRDRERDANYRHL